MSHNDLNRREFNTLAAAAFGGVIAGTVAGCGKKKKTDKTEKTVKTGKTGGGEKVTAVLNSCKGLNACEGKGADGKNKCKGLGTCATTKAHSCHGENDCRGQGGCDGKAGTNECKGKGGCASPVDKDKWAAAKDAFDKKHSLGKYMKKAG